MIDLIIFDCDGVLVDSEPIANQTLADHASAFGVPMTMEDSMRHFVGLSMKSVMEKLGQMASRPVPENFLDRLQADTFARFEHQLKPVSGIMAALDAIEAMGLATCVASSGGHDKLAVTLGLTGLRPRFEGRIYSATEVKSGKPAPDLFLYAAQQNNVEIFLHQFYPLLYPNNYVSNQLYLILRLLDWHLVAIFRINSWRS
jgi:beta-phosphoglucomutase-like phosphatase (HAD superfamily)